MDLPAGREATILPPTIAGRTPFYQVIYYSEQNPLAAGFISESLCSAPLAAFSYRGNQQMGFFDKGQRGAAWAAGGEELSTNLVAPSMRPRMAGAVIRGLALTPEEEMPGGVVASGRRFHAGLALPPSPPRGHWPLRVAEHEGEPRYSVEPGPGCQTPRAWACAHRATRTARCVPTVPASVKTGRPSPQSHSAESHDLPS